MDRECNPFLSKEIEAVQSTSSNKPEGRGCVSLSYLFLKMAPAFREEVVRQALVSREQVSAGAREALSGAISKHAVVNGFRNATLAPPFMLLDTVARKAQVAADLASALLGVWVESKGPLRAVVAGHLEAAGVATPLLELPGPEIRIGRGDHPLVEAADSFQTSHPEADADEIMLLMELLVGTMVTDETPEDGVENSLADTLAATFKTLSSLPPTSLEWQDIIPNFVSSITSLVDAKEAERNLAVNLDRALADIWESHPELIKFFQWNTTRWRAANLSPDAEIVKTHGLAVELKELLSRYAPIHELAPVATEEIHRTKQRLELLPGILEVGRALDEMMQPGDDANDSGPDDGPADDSPEPSDNRGGGANAGPATVSQPGEAEVAQPQPDIETAGPPSSAKEGLTPIPPLDHFEEAPSCDIESYMLLRMDNLDLEQENNDLENEVQSLKKQLFESRNEGEGWRQALAYHDSGAGGEAEEATGVRDVASAVELARERFEGRLLFRFNSDSTIEDNPFKWPELVWKALEWLATSYYDSRIGYATNADMDLSCRSVSGMWYKSSQHDTTMTAFRNSYTTKVGGRTIWLDEHIGKGTGFDPRRTIRIGFDWDHTLQKVIIGYLGQHQRTSVS